MKYETICKGKFLERPNRFVAYVEVDGIRTKAHVKNTGRCRELLLPGAAVFLEDFSQRMGKRSLRYSLVGVEKRTDRGCLMVNMDSQAPNKVVKEALEEGRLIPAGLSDISRIKAEHVYGSSRLDFFVQDSAGQKLLAEVKGVTLEENGTARFPDAPTERGIRHIEELIAAVDDGYHACIIFVIQMKGISCFEPNYATHPQFGEALCRARAAGVEILAFDCIAGSKELKLDRPVPIKLEKRGP